MCSSCAPFEPTHPAVSAWFVYSGHSFALHWRDHPSMGFRAKLFVKEGRGLQACGGYGDFYESPVCCAIFDISARTMLVLLLRSCSCQRNECVIATTLLALSSPCSLFHHCNPARVEAKRARELHWRSPRRTLERTQLGHQSSVRRCRCCGVLGEG